MFLTGWGPSRGVLANSYVIQLLSWRAGFWFASIASGLSLIGVLLFVPEVSVHTSHTLVSDPI